MSCKLKTLLHKLDGAGMIAVDDDMTIETLNEAFGINIHHDLVITSDEVKTLKNALGALQILALAESDEFLENLADKALEILE